MESEVALVIYFTYFSPMRIIAFILAIYTLGLAILPCNDVHAGAEGVLIVHQNSDDHQEHNDVCAPFCQCSCCQCFVVLTQAKTTLTLSFPASISFSIYNESIISYATVDHWQPPRLG